ncbi:hypothetical protein, partial [Rhizobium sp. 60-20]|uniref:hypothetical protein n=1 Tax=Rhizobium sp. 60-20 TaxID=1895819 RepID=UPI0025E8F224
KIIAESAGHIASDQITSRTMESEINQQRNLEGYLRSHGQCGDFGRPHVSRIELRRGLFDAAMGN